MDNREEKIRVRAYEIWEGQGRSGSPEDHWFPAKPSTQKLALPRGLEPLFSP